MQGEKGDTGPEGMVGEEGDDGQKGATVSLTYIQQNAGTLNSHVVHCRYCAFCSSKLYVRAYGWYTEFTCIYIQYILQC